MPDFTVLVFLTGLVTGLSLIVAIGAQNAFLLRMGLLRHHVGEIVVLCTVADALLISLGIGGVGQAIRTLPWLLQTLRYAGAAYIVYFAITSFRRALHPVAMDVAAMNVPKRSSVVTTTLALTFLNPHVYVDSILLLGSIGNQYGSQRWFFGAGAVLASALWFTALGYGARFASGLMGKARTWAMLDAAIGVVMLLVAVNVLTAKV